MRRERERRGKGERGQVGHWSGRSFRRIKSIPARAKAAKLPFREGLEGLAHFEDHSSHISAHPRGWQPPRGGRRSQTRRHLATFRRRVSATRRGNVAVRGRCHIQRGSNFSLLLSSSHVAATSVHVAGWQRQRSCCSSLLLDEAARFRLPRGHGHSRQPPRGGLVTSRPAT